MSAKPEEQSQPATTTSTPAPTTTLAANMSAGTPVQTYPSPAAAQWAAHGVIDPALQQQSAAAKPLTTTVPTMQLTPGQAAYSYYSHYPQHYTSYQYLQAAAQHQQQQHSAATSVAASHRATFTVATTPAVATSSTPAPVTAATTTTVTPATAPATAAAPAASSLDTSDIATLNDALGSAGVDLRAEEESLQRSNLTIPTYTQSATSLYLQNRPYEDRSRKQPSKPQFNTTTLGATMRTIGTEHKITRIPEDTVNYMALALRARLQDLITAMIEASRYRKEAQFDRPASMYETLQPQLKQEDDATQTPMWSIVVRSDVAKQLAVLERVEREEELRIRRERKERLELAAQHAANLSAQTNGAMMGIESTNGGMATPGGADDMDGQPKKKKKKDGPGVTARNMSEDVRKKMSNAVATQAAGLGKYSWMTATSAPASTPKKQATTPAPSTPVTTPAASTAGTWARPYVPKKAQPEKTTTESTTPAAEEDPSKITVTMRDAMFVIEKERGHGAGRGSARGWR